MKPLKKIDGLIQEEETKWVLFVRAVEDLDLAEEDLLALEEVRERVWKDEKKSLGEMIGIEIINASGQTKINPLHEIVIKIQDEVEA